MSSDFLRDPLLASCDCENYQSETENGSDENNKPCFNLRTFVGVKMQVLFHLEHKIHLLRGNAACLSPTLWLTLGRGVKQQFRSLVSPCCLISFFGEKTNMLIICQKLSFYLYHFDSSESRVLFLFCLFSLLLDAGFVV